VKLTEIRTQTVKRLDGADISRLQINFEHKGVVVDMVPGEIDHLGVAAVLEEMAAAIRREVRRP
jgi:hypothetical protein